MVVLFLRFLKWLWLSLYEGSKLLSVPSIKFFTKLKNMVVVYGICNSDFLGGRYKYLRCT